MNYAAGFEAGERAAFNDRHEGTQRIASRPRCAYDRGFWDGYCPRSATWGAMQTTSRSRRTIEPHQEAA